MIHPEVATRYDPLILPFRVSLACTRCRDSKKKCDGNSPCARCSRLARGGACVYEPVDPTTRVRRKRKPCSADLTEENSTSPDTTTVDLWDINVSDFDFSVAQNVLDCLSSPQREQLMYEYDHPVGISPWNNLYLPDERVWMEFREFYRQSFRSVAQFLLSAQRSFAQGGNPVPRGTYNWWVETTRLRGISVETGMEELERQLRNLTLIPVPPIEQEVVIDYWAQCREKIQALKQVYHDAEIGVVSVLYNSTQPTDSYINRQATNLLGVEQEHLIQMKSKPGINSFFGMWPSFEWSRIFSMLIRNHSRQLPGFSLRCYMSHTSGATFETILSTEFTYSHIGTPLMVVMYLTPL